MTDAHTFAAVDLGSNSFHLVVARQVDGELQVVDRLRERVQLASGIDETGRLNGEAQQRALQCLHRFGQRLADFHPERVRVVGTSAMRKSLDGERFREAAELAIGHPVEVISGQEEARLIYLGVTLGLDDGDERRLVVDIGGGSTECIVGVGPQIDRAASFHMGCVEFSERYFPDGRITAKAMERAVIAARLELGPVHRAFRKLDWRVVYGSSGTIHAVQEAIHAQGWDDHAITVRSLKRLGEALVAAGHVDALAALPGVKSERAPVLAGGYAVLRGVFRGLKLKRMVAVRSALREGLLYDMLGLGVEGDLREQSVRRLAERCGVDQEHAERVERVACRLFDQLAPTWGLPPAEWRPLLGWAATLHEAGRVIAFSGLHKHGAYLITNADLPGFSISEQSQLAALVLGHRRKLDVERIRVLAASRTQAVFRLAALLRLAVCVCRTRSPNPRPLISARAEGDRLHLEFPSGWLAQRPLTRADLEEETQRLRPTGVLLTWGESAVPG